MEKRYTNTATLEETVKDFESVCKRVRPGDPLIIMKNGEPYLVVIDYHEYLERFGCLLPEEEYTALKKMDKNE